MNRYSYEAVDSSGVTQTGEMDSPSVADVVRQLAEKGLELIAVERIAEHALAPAEELQPTVGSSGVAEAGDPEFLPQLSNAIEKRGAWLPALRAMCDEMPVGDAKKAALELVGELEANMTSTTVVASKSAPALLPLLNVGSTEGFNAQKLVDWLNVLLRYRQQKQRSRRAWAYPFVLLSLAFVVTAGIAIFLVPIFEEMFDEFGLVLPAPTKAVLAISHLITSRSGGVVTALVLGGVFLGFLLRRYWIRNALTNRLLHGFVTGTSGNLHAMSVLSGTLAELLSFGAPLPDALRIAGSHCGHKYFDIAVNQLGKDAANGVPCSESKAAGRLPPMLLYALEHSGKEQKGVSILREIASVYRDRIGTRTGWVTSSLPSFAVAIIGVIVAFVIIALFMPLVGMISSLA